LADPAPTNRKDATTSEPWTVMSVLRWTTGRFEERGLPTPRLDAEVLIASALGLPRLQLYVQFDRPLGPEELGAIREAVKRRQAGQSVAYVVGHKEFFGLDFAVDPRVLVPRPDTETLVDEALARLGAGGLARKGSAQAAEPTDPVEAVEPAEAGADEAPAPSAVAPSPPLPVVSPRIADVGTGSGAIIVSLGKRLPGAALYAVDASSDALAVARANADRHGVRVTFLEGDLAEPLAAFAPFDLIAANLPYIPSAEIATLAPEVRAEPRAALDGGPDGLDLIRRLVTAAPPLLAPGGALALEVGAGQAAAVAAICLAAGLADIQQRRDLGSVDRVVSARKP
jgi:release factor glutamine methyltransferase